MCQWLKISLKTSARIGKTIIGRKMCLVLLLIIILSRVHIVSAKTNDPLEPDKTLDVQSTQKPAIPLREISQLEERIAELQKEIDELKLKTRELELDKKAAQQLLDISEKNLEAPRFFMALITLILIIISFVGSLVVYVVRIQIIRRSETADRKLQKNYDRLNTEFKKEQEEFNVHIQEEEREICHVLARTHNLMAIDFYEKGKLAEAVKLGEKAADHIERAFGKSPKERDNLFLATKIKSNLAYYYAVTDRTDKSSLSLEYAKIGLQVGEEFSDIDMIDNFLFVWQKFGIGKKFKKKWIETYENCKDKLQEYKRLTAQERQVYKNYYNQIKGTSFS